MLLLILSTSIYAHMQAGENNTDFHRNFNDSTLRLDYIFAGGPEGPHIFLESMTKQPGWAGRKSHLKSGPLQGNATILVKDIATGDTLYCNPFSPLFLEWLNTSEASERPMAFENSLLVPLPKSECVIQVILRDNRFKEIVNSSFVFDPKDNLVAIKERNQYPVQYLHKGNSPENAIDIAILAEGFREDEMDKFITKSQEITDEILRYEPFASNKEKFNFIAVKTPSIESGVSIPKNNIWSNTLFGAHFGTFHSDRYLTVPRVWRMHDSLEGIPYEHIFVVVNTPEYGGGGFFNCYQVASSDNIHTLPVAVHEFGHSFAGLADEYFYEGEEDETYPLDIEPWEANITTLSDFDTKWRDRLPAKVKIPTPWDEKTKPDKKGKTNLGVYEGGGYRFKGIYRPTPTCRMRDNYYPSFCPVCEETLQLVIDFYTE